MADYQPLIARAVAGLDRNTGENRRMLYERARNALVAQLRGVVPALEESEVTRERLALEEAIRKVEAESARQVRAAAKPANGKRAEVLQSAEPTHSEPLRPEPPRPAQVSVQPSPQQAAGVRRTLSDEGFKELRDIIIESNLSSGERNSGRQQAAVTPERAVPPSLPPQQHQAPVEHRQPGPRTQPEKTWSPPLDGTRTQAPIDLDEAYPPTTRPRPAWEEPEAAAVAVNDIESLRQHRPPRSYGRLIRMMVILLLIAGVGVLAYWQRGTIAGIAGGITALFRSPSTPLSREATAPARPKIADRIGQPELQAPAGLPVAQRVVLYEEDPGDAEGKRFTGVAIWRVETRPATSGRPPEMAVRADIDVPERNMKVTWSLRRNTDPSLPASHTIEVSFALPADSPSGGVQNVPGVLMKQAEQTRGVPLAGLAVRVTPGFFLIGLSSMETDMQRNVQLLKERSWFDIPVVYNNNRRAILAVEKGAPGEKVFADVFAAWRQ
jgi:hypothetical protein